MISVLELAAAHFLFGTLSGFWFQCGLVAFGNILLQRKTFAGYIIFFYLATNFYVNLCDFIYKAMLESGAIRGYYHDEFFLSSFSYKVH